MPLVHFVLQAAAPRTWTLAPALFPDEAWSASIGLLQAKRLVAELLPVEMGMVAFGAGARVVPVGTVAPAAVVLEQMCPHRVGHQLPW